MPKITYAGPDQPEKKAEELLKKEFEEKAKAAREKFFEKKEAGAKPAKGHPTPLQRRMYSGGV
ncbi:MAG: hypothetical protein WA418_28615 [Bradyrhizobium sp.]